MLVKRALQHHTKATLVGLALQIVAQCLCA